MRPIDADNLSIILAADYSGMMCEAKRKLECDAISKAAELTISRVKQAPTIRYGVQDLSILERAATMWQEFLQPRCADISIQPGDVAAMIALYEIAITGRDNHA